MGEVVFAPSRTLKEAAGAMKPRRKRKPRAPVASDFDDRLKITNRVFEVVRCYPLGGGDSIIERRIRIRIPKGGLEDSVYEVGEVGCYVGYVSEHLGSGKGVNARDKWSPYTWGHVPVQGCDWAREIISDDNPVTPHKKEEKSDDKAV